MQTKVLQPDADGIAEAAEILGRGGLVAFPTETVYGLGADARSDVAVARIYEAKQRPAFNPLIAHIANMAAARSEGVFDARAETLAAAFWPGPLTLVVPAAPQGSVALLARAGLDTIALRVPAHPVAQALLERFGGPVAAPSANPSGSVSPTMAAHVLESLSGRIDAVLDAGPCAVGLESTIVDCCGPEPAILRPGGVSRADIEAVLGAKLPRKPPQADAGKPLAPGMLASHYAPRARVRLRARSASPGEGILDFAGQLAGYAMGSPYADLSASGDVTEAAANLFASLRQLDATGVAQIAVAPIPGHSLGEAINDRLRRAAAGR